MTVKICPYPFSRIELGAEKTFVPCCGFWLTDQYHNLESGEDPWEGPAAIELRRRILSGDYTLCKRDLCMSQLISVDDLQTNPSFNREASINRKVLADITAGKPELSSGPVSVSVAGDPRCNLSCPTCRGKVINELTAHNKERIFHAVAMLKRYKSSIETVKMSAEGEVFHSPWLRRLLQVINPKVFPKLKAINLLSNGTLFSKENYNKLRPGTEYIREVCISIDAGDEETYRDVRRGNWKSLQKNLEFISSLRRDKLSFFGLLFVARKANYKSMDNVVKLAKELGVDEVSFSPFSPWCNMGVLNYESEAIHLPGHPEHKQFIEICEKLRENSIVNMRISY